LPTKSAVQQIWGDTEKLKYTTEQATEVAMSMPSNFLEDSLLRATSSLDSWNKRVLYTLFLVSLGYGFEILLFGVIPLGEPNTSNTSSKLPWLMATNPITYTLLSCLLAVVFYSILDESRPFRALRDYLPVVGSQYIVQIVVLSMIYPFTDTFILMGLVPFVLCILSTLVALKLMEKWIWTCRCRYYHVRLKDFRLMCINLAAYIAVLCVWTIGYRQATSQVQFMMPFVLLFLVFGFKKWMLSLSDKYPLVIAMMLAGFALENLDDTFQTLVFPVVDRPGIGFFTIGFRKFLENVAYLGFFTSGWFKFCIWIKDAFKNFFTCKRGNAVAHTEAIYAELDLNDRGHSNQMQGYHRRQAQFFMYKIISQVLAYIFFLSVTPILRFGVNSNYYPLSSSSTLFLANQPGVTILEDDDYRNALIFAAAMLLVTVLSGFFAFILLRKYREITFNQIRNFYKPLFASPHYLNLLFVIMLTNQLLALAVVQYHNRIWFYNISDTVRE
jgi:hypothetical protein